MREYEHMNTLIIILLRITNVVVHIYDSTAAAHNILIQLLECAIPPPTRMPIFQKRKGFFLSDFEFDGDTRDLLVTKFTDFQDIFKFLRENVDFDLDGNSSKTERAIGDPLVAK